MTAWGTSGEITVAYKDDAYTTAKMPEYTDDKTGLDPPQPNPDEGDGEGDNDDGDDGNDDGDGDDPINDGTCADTNNGQADPWGDDCAAYWDFLDWCELTFEDSTFEPKEMCCACGGGEPIEEGDGDEEGEEEEE